MLTLDNHNLHHYTLIYTIVALTLVLFCFKRYQIYIVNKNKTLNKNKDHITTIKTEQATQTEKKSETPKFRLSISTDG